MSAPTALNRAVGTAFIMAAAPPHVFASGRLLESLLQAAVLAIDLDGVRDEETQRADLRRAIVDYVGEPRSGSPLSGLAASA